MLQRYVSKELTHFVGRSLASDDERYELLLKILKGGLLKGTGINDKHIEMNRFGVSANLYDMDKNLIFTKETLVESPSVCFCDIPVNDLSIHMSKYGKLGLSFQKDFLIEKRANPIFYVAIDSKSNYANSDLNRGTSFNEQLREFICFIIFLIDDNFKETIYGGVTDLDKIRKFFFLEILPFLKPFECYKSDTDEKNYYMEREWRVLGFVKFAMDDVSRIILPESYIGRFREDVPDYYGQITFADEYSI